MGLAGRSVCNRLHAGFALLSPRRARGGSASSHVRTSLAACGAGAAPRAVLCMLLSRMPLLAHAASRACGSLSPTPCTKAASLSAAVPDVQAEAQQVVNLIKGSINKC